MFFRKLRRRLMGNHRFRHRDGEHHLALNVPPSRKEVVMRRRRVILRAVQWSAGAGLGLWGVIAAGDLWDRAFLTSTTYAVGQFELVTNGAITAPQVAAVTGLRPDQNITTLHLGALRRQLLTLPQVREAAVERRLPNHLSIRLEERRPAAWLACARQGLRAFDSRGLLLDAEGVVFPAGVMLNEYTALPVIHCADLSAVTPGRQVEYPLIRQALELVQLIRLQPWPQPMSVEQIRLTNRFTMVAQMDTDALFTFHPDHLDQQLARLHAILTKIAPSKTRVATVNLQLERNVPVTFFDPPPSATKAAPKPGTGAPTSRRAALPARRGN